MVCMWACVWAQALSVSTMYTRTQPFYGKIPSISTKKLLIYIHKHTRCYIYLHPWSDYKMNWRTLCKMATLGGRTAVTANLWTKSDGRRHQHSPKVALLIMPVMYDEKAVKDKIPSLGYEEVPPIFGDLTILALFSKSSLIHLAIFARFNRKSKKKISCSLTVISFHILTLCTK